MKPIIVIPIVIIVIIGIVIGLIAYSYTQIQFSLENISYQGLDFATPSGTTLLKLAADFLTGNWMGFALTLVTGVKLGLAFGLSNHGFFPIYIPDVSYDILVNDVKIGQGQSHISSTINPGETKSFQDDSQDIKFASIEPVIESIVSSGGMANFQVSGTAYFNFLGINIPVPFHSSKQINIVDEVKSHFRNYLSGNQQSSQNSYQGNQGYGNSSPAPVQTSMSIESSSYNVYQGQSVTFSGHLTDLNGNGIANQIVYVKRDISFATDLVLGTSYTDSNGYYSVDWIATKPVLSNTANIYATFDGNSDYSNVRSGDISIQVYLQQTQTTTNPSSSLDQQAQQNSQPSTSVTIVNNVYKVGPGTYTYIPFSIPCTASTSGSFAAQAALGSNIDVIILDQNNFEQMSNHQQATAYYNSGKVQSGSFNIILQPGQFYIVLSNTYSAFSTKTVSIDASYTCS